MSRKEYNNKNKITVKDITDEMKGQFIMNMYGFKKKLSPKQIKIIIDNFFDRVLDHISAGDRVCVIGFGSFGKTEHTYKKAFDFKRNKFIYDVRVNRIHFRTSTTLKKLWSKDRRKPEVPKEDDHHETQSTL